ncbi:glutamine synthetase family protein [Streptomyces acidiscabies]
MTATVNNTPLKQEKTLPLADLVTAGTIDTVLLALPDLQGRLKGKRYDAGHFLTRIADHGAEMCAYLLATDVDMNPADGFALTSWDTGYQDLPVRPDLTTARVVPWMPRTAIVLADAMTPEGTPVEIAPRHILDRQLTRLAHHGLHPKTGIETEFVLYKGTHNQPGHHPLHPLTTENLDYALDHNPTSDRFFRRLQRALAKAGIPVEAIKTEAGPGQIEVTFPYGPARDACDNHLLFKHAVRTLATRSDLTPTFMAAPETGRANGLHLHLSLWSNNTPQLNAPDGNLSDTARHAIAGLLTALPELAPFYAPTTNSYKRFTPSSFAPATFNWGHDNRTCAIRVIGHDDTLHLEIRVPGADANPYLALAATLAAITHGIDHKLDPGPPETGNSYRTHHIPALPTLADALTVFEDSALARNAFGTDVIDHYAHLAKLELDHERTHVTDTERQRWLTRA